MSDISDSHYNAINAVSTWLFDRNSRVGEIKACSVFIKSILEDDVTRIQQIKITLRNSMHKYAFFNVMCFQDFTLICYLNVHG